MSVEEKVLELIRPDDRDRERLEKVAEEVLSRLKGFDAQIQGSFRKGTWLKGDTDIDIFVFYPKEVGKEYLKKKSLKELIQVFKDLNYEIAFAEHPYLILKINNVEVDVVPALKIDSGEDAITAADRTPFHTKFVTTHLDEKGKDEVRLLKQFMKGIGVYGAEIKVKGFSGYVAELLTIYYGNFRKVLESAKTWKPPIKLNLVEPKRDFDEPLQIPDPVDPKRNTASAVSLRNIAVFSLASKIFIEKPSIEFFFPTEIKAEEIIGDVLLIKIEFKEKSVEDIIWGQVWKNVEKLKNAIKTAGFSLIDIGAWGNSQTVKIAVQIEDKNISRYYLNQGPYFYVNGVDNFMKKNNYVWVGEDGRLYSLKERRETNLEKIVLNSLSFKENFSVQMTWLSDINQDDKELHKFLRKRPTWMQT
ncbi:tRNA CCA-pyrophosphorylase [Sulfolobus acidocaldarius SUSAZ]|nr:tRNA CCA-pyrophosphorylase [Sulfolobus acidocaldarius SUSAZ]